MRLIYVDEAGTSPAEPVRVVAAVIVHGDDQLRLLANELERIFDERVPTNIREGFYFHGMEVFNGGKKIKRGEWPLDDRLDFFKEILSLPRVHDIPIAVGITFSGAYKPAEDFLALLESKNIGLHAYEHGAALSSCLERSDKFLRKYLGGKEVGVVIVENVNNNKKLLSALGMVFRNSKIDMLPEDLHPSKAMEKLGLNASPETLEITNIIDVPHFVDKSGAPMLQLADACAFAFRRFLAGKSHGKDLCLAMLGPEEGASFVNDPVWFSGTSSGLFNTIAYWSEEQRKDHEEKNTKLRILQALNMNRSEKPNVVVFMDDGDNFREL